MSKKEAVEVTDELVAQAEQQINLYSKKINFFMSEYTVEILAEKMAKEEYTVPSYQRAFTWDEPRKSRFIESLIMGLPIPFIFFWQNDETGKLEIVDGSQRLRTLEEFFKKDLVLSGLKRLGLLNGFRFKDLPMSRQRKILNKSIRGIILPDNTDLEARIDLFDRINTGSKVANSAEIRRGVLQGPFLEMITDLSKSEQLFRLAPVSKKQSNERESEELVTRFFAYSDGLDGYKDDVSPFLFRYIQRMNSEFRDHPDMRQVYESRFQLMLDFVDQHFEFGFKKTENAKTTPRSRFEAIAIGSYLALQEKPYLNVSREKINEILESSGFKKEIRSDGANAKKRLTGRINFIRDALLEA